MVPIEPDASFAQPSLAPGAQTACYLPWLKTSVYVGLKPHAQVRDEMARFMAEDAPAFDGAHR